ncbi:MAG: DegT/DnrJ/EryC1/StrS family aminotransferase [Gammaproteobacteria bacterium]|nr:DegT/DnrJ/EryC1/StrS family aminotransferase [Gammaproteobacteria bacterium]
MSKEITSVPFLDLTKEFSSLEEEWFAMIREVGSKGAFILGENVSAFEREAAEYLGVKSTISVANGTDALVLSLRALGVGPGDEVITSPYTFFASAEAVNMVGATPVFADIDYDSFCLDPDSVRSKITGKTRAIIPVHIFGQPVNMDALGSIASDHGLRIVEDCAQAFGASDGQKRVGAWGDAGSFSFYPTKVLGCYGDGGLISTNNEEIDAHIRKLRNHGATAPFMHDEIGTNSRLDEIQAALLRIKLRSMDVALAGRRRVAAMYTERLKDVAIAVPAIKEGIGHAYNLFTIRINNRDQVRERLTNAKVGSSLCYPLPLHLQEVYKPLGYKPGDLPVAEKASTEALSLPIYPDMPKDHIQYVCDLVVDAVSG